MSYIFDSYYDLVVKLNKREKWGKVNRVKFYRGVKKISQLELARAIGVSRQTINMIENNKYNPSLKLCINIAKTLGVTLDDLFWEDDR